MTRSECTREKSRSRATRAAALIASAKRERPGAVLSPQAAAGAFERRQRPLAKNGPIRFDGHQRRDGTAVPDNDRRLALFSRLEKLPKLIARFFYALAPHRRNLTAPYRLSQAFDRSSHARN